jgi:hypothetical protein
MKTFRWRFSRNGYLRQQKLPILPIRHCRNSRMPKENALKDKIKDKMSSTNK